MQHQTQKRITMLALLIGALALSGCGAKITKSGNSAELASRTVNDAGASCNSFSASSSKLSGKIKVYVDPFGSARTDMMHLKITGIDANFDSNNKYVLKMFRWKASMDSSPYIDQNALDFAIFRNGNQLSSAKDSINVTDLKNIQSQYGVPGTTSSEFFRNTDIVVYDTDLTWDVLKLVIYENVSTSQSNVVAEVDVLMPAFSADPKIYAEDHPYSLQVLHPFYYDQNEDMDFAAAAQSFCF